MGIVTVKCTYCGKEFQRETRRFNEAIKLRWNFYCSIRCQSQAKNKQKEVKCGNPKCQKNIKRQLKDIPISGICFCSNSCSAITRNKNRKKWKICMTCGKKYSGINKKFCSYNCVRMIPPKPTIKITSEQIIRGLKEFYKTNGRIPYKKEFKHMKAARSRFGTWNKAVVAAGFKPNPVKFANKHIANDGHKCDSLAEKIIDDWLFAKRISHETKVPYNYHQMTADFRIGEIYVEFFGLRGGLKSYDRLIKEKENLWRTKRLRVIKIFPDDLFPENKLDKIFAII